MLQEGDGPCEGEAPLPEAVGHVYEVDQDEEEKEDRDVVNDHVHVPAHLLEPVHETEGAQNARHVLYDRGRLPDCAQLHDILNKESLPSCRRSRRGVELGGRGTERRTSRRRLAHSA